MKSKRKRIKSNISELLKNIEENNNIHVFGGTHKNDELKEKDILTVMTSEAGFELLSNCKKDLPMGTFPDTKNVNIKNKI